MCRVQGGDSLGVVVGVWSATLGLELVNQLEFRDWECEGRVEMCVFRFFLNLEWCVNCDWCGVDRKKI